MRAVTGEDLDLEIDYKFLMLCNDFIVDILKVADSKAWSSEELNIKERDVKKFNSQKYDVLYWREHGYATAINRSLYRHMFFSLISDYNKYVYDAVDCAAKYHFGPAFTLIRKPFKDDLLLLEIMFIKGHKFIPEFLKRPANDYAIDKISKDTKKIKGILRKSCKKLDFFKGYKMYNLRYNKKSKESLEKIWNKTSHIITSCKEYATTKGNLNIIFATDEQIEEHIVYFYKVCSSIQLYFLTLVLNILLEEKLISDELYNLNMINLYFAFSCTLDKEITDEQEQALLMKCNHCGSITKINKKIIKDNNKNKSFEYFCEECKKKNQIIGFIYKDENI